MYLNLLEYTFLQNNVKVFTSQHLCAVQIILTRYLATTIIEFFITRHISLSVSSSFYRISCIFFYNVKVPSESLSCNSVVGIGWTSWKKRWFILTSTSLVFFRSDPVSWIKLNSYLIIMLTNIFICGGGGTMNVYRECGQRLIGNHGSCVRFG